MGGYLLDKQTRAERIEEVLEVFPILATHLRRFVGTMSGGERKMVAVGRALMTSPRVVVFDEPTAGLAPALVRSVLEDQARALADRGKAVLLVEQRAHAALELSDWAYVLVQGPSCAVCAGGRGAREPRDGGGLPRRSDQELARRQAHQAKAGDELPEPRVMRALRLGPGLEVEGCGEPVVRRDLDRAHHIARKPGLE